MILYQTVEDRNNPDDIERESPYLCNAYNAWLGEGYYLWDTLINNAHWWGRSHYNKNNYVIVEFICDDINNSKCFDLHGNMEHLQLFKRCMEFFKEESLLSDKDTVSKVISYLKSKTDFLDRYEAIRAYGHYSKSKPQFVSFEKNKKYALELEPAVQLCLFKKSSLNLSKGKIVYPLNYTSDYII